jgi:hypothetical protein
MSKIIAAMATGVLMIVVTMGYGIVAPAPASAKGKSAGIEAMTPFDVMMIKNSRGMRSFKNAAIVASL